MSSPSLRLVVLSLAGLHYTHSAETISMYHETAILITFTPSANCSTKSVTTHRENIHTHSSVCFSHRCTVAVICDKWSFAILALLRILGIIQQGLHRVLHELWWLWQRFAFQCAKIYPSTKYSKTETTHQYWCRFSNQHTLPLLMHFRWLCARFAHTDTSLYRFSY